MKNLNGVKLVVSRIFTSHGKVNVGILGDDETYVASEKDVLDIINSNNDRIVRFEKKRTRTHLIPLEKEIKILVDKMGCEHDDSFWYRGDGVLATLKVDGRYFNLEPRGVIEVQFEEDGEYFRNEEAVHEASSRNLVDGDLGELHEFDGWRNNNWLVTIEVDANGNDVSDDINVIDGYDSGINALVELRQSVLMGKI